jgi:inhibitor of the kinA pathway to sporulation, predicted exonuclease
MIIFDLEWNRGDDTKSLDEILQIGAVKIEGLGRPVLDSFNIYIRPRVHKVFGPGAKNLPDLQKSIDSDVDFPQGLSKFLAWCGKEREFGAWGSEGFKALKQNCEYWKLPVPAFQKKYNLQQAFGHVIGEDSRQVALQSAIETCRIPIQDTFHNALHDATYTAAISAWITEESLTYRLLKKRIRRKIRLPQFSMEQFPIQPKYRVSPYLSMQTVLNAKRARQPKCPICQKPMCVHRWSGPIGKPYWAHRRCPSIC